MREKLQETWEKFNWLLDAIAQGIADGIYDFFNDND